MSGAVIDPRLASGRAAPSKRFQLSWSDPRFRNIVWQVIIIGAVVAIVWYLVANTNTNLANRHVTTGFGFLGRVASIPIGEYLIPYDPSVSTYAQALLIGLLNTLRVAVVGVILATLLGTLIGIARLSRNWLLAKLSAIYVEVIRDIPVLLQLLFWYATLQSLPAPRQSFHPVTGVFLSNRGVKFPLLDWVDQDWWVLLAFLAGVIGTVIWSRMATRKQEATGVRPPAWPVALGLLIVLPLVVWAAVGAPFSPDIPELRGFNFVGGGTLSPEYGALTIGLVIYTAAYIAEIVRSGILSVATGQWEAAGALGLWPGLMLRKIVLPQAMRVIIPPMTSQFLNLTKNSVAGGRDRLLRTSMSVDGTTILNQTGQSVGSHLHRRWPCT